VSTVTTNSTVSAVSTELSDGTGKVIGVVAAVPRVVVVPAFFTEVICIGAALADVATRVLIVMAATMARAIFLNEFI
jgi:hypothetical protein